MPGFNFPAVLAAVAVVQGFRLFGPGYVDHEISMV